MLTSAAPESRSASQARQLQAAPGASSLATRSAEPLTGSGTRLGTFPYMAPEQVEGKEADARSDVFALGARWYLFGAHAARRVPPHGSGSRA